jgi:hypothetical protein
VRGFLQEFRPRCLVTSMAESNDNNLLDFTVIKLKSLAEDYNKKHYYEMAQQVEDCLEAYLDGDVTVLWKNGLPYVKLKKEESKK